MYYSNRKIYQESENFAIFSNFRNKYDSRELSLKIAQEAPCNPLIQYFFIQELGHEISEHIQDYKDASVKFLEMFKSEWRLFYWKGLFTILEDRASLSDKSVVESKIEMMDYFMKQIEEFLIKHCFESSSKVVLKDVQMVPLKNSNQGKLKNFKIADLNSETVQNQKNSLLEAQNDIFLSIPDYIFKPIERPEEDDHLVFLWLKRLAGKSVNNEQFFHQMSMSGMSNPSKINENPDNIGKNISENSIKFDFDQKNIEIEFRRKQLKSKLIENRNQKVFPLAIPEFLYSPNYNSKLFSKFHSTMFYNLNTDLDYQYKKKSFLLGNEMKALDMELKKVDSLFSKWFITLPKNSSIRFFSNNDELITRFMTMEVNPKNLQNLYLDCIKNLKETISSIIMGKNVCKFEPNILIILTYILSYQAKKKFAKLDQQFKKRRKLKFNDMINKPRYFVKALNLKSPEIHDNLGIHTFKLNKILCDKQESEKILMKFVNQYDKNYNKFSNYYSSKTNISGFGNSQKMSDFQKMNPDIFGKSLKFGNSPNPQFPGLRSSYYDSVQSKSFSSKFKKDNSKFLTVLLEEVTNKDKRVILSEKIIKKLKSISLGYEMKKLFRNNPIYDFKNLKHLLFNLNHNDHNTFELEQGHLLFNKSKHVFDKIQKYNDQFCVELSNSLSADEFNLSDFDLTIKDFVSKNKLQLYKELMQDSLNTFFIDKNFVDFLLNINFLKELCLILNNFQKKITDKGILDKNPICILNDDLYGSPTPLLL